jgi:hypothetical protein
MAQRPVIGQMATVHVRNGATHQGQFIRVDDTATGWAGGILHGIGGIVYVSEAEVDSIDLAGIAPLQSTIVRTYRGKQQSDVAVQFRKDAQGYARWGYEPSSQSWASGQWGWGAWLAAFALCLLLVGILVFIYMLIVKPDGTLTVTFVMRAAPVPPAPTSPIGEAAPPLQERLTRLQEAKDAGVLTEDEYVQKRAKVIDEAL